MAQFSVYRTATGDFLLDCQSDLLDHFNTRFVVPIMPPELAPHPGAFLNPRFIIVNEPFIMVTQFAASVPTSELQGLVVDLSSEHFTILRALDMLITGI